ARTVKEHRDRLVLVPHLDELPEASLRREVSEDAVVVRELAAEDRRARGTAERVAHEEPGERGSLIGEQGAQTRQRVERARIETVGEDEDEAGARIRRAGGDGGGGNGHRPESQ